MISFIGWNKDKKKAGEEEDGVDDEMQMQQELILMKLGEKYEIGRTLGAGNLGKVKYAKDVGTEQSFAIKIINNHVHISNEIKKEIGTLKLLKHPNVVRLHEVLASKTKIYMVLEYVTGGELLDTITSNGKLPESDARKLFQQLIDGVSYCHDKGIFHRDLKLEYVLVDAKGNIKISNFGLSTLPAHCKEDGGNPNHLAPEILSNRGYDAAASDTWSCGVILYVILTGYLPFEDRNVSALYQKIFNGEVNIPKGVPSGAKSLIQRILDPNPKTRMKMADIKADEWFKEDYTPYKPNQDDNEEDHDINIDDEVLSIQETPDEEEMSWSSGLTQVTQDVSEKLDTLLHKRN